MNQNYGYNTRNTDCRDATRDQKGFYALGRLMLAEIKKRPSARRRDPGVCSCCGRGLPVAYTVFDLKTGADGMPTKYDLAPDDAERIAKMKAADAKGETVGNMPRFLVFPHYHCAILVDAWYWDIEHNRKRSPVDLGEELERKEKAEARMAFRDVEQPKQKLGIERLESLRS